MENPVNHIVNGQVLNDMCPKGYYCPKGTSSPLPCPQGTFSNVTMLEDESACEICPRGISNNILYAKKTCMA